MKQFLKFKCFLAKAAIGAILFTGIGFSATAEESVEVLHWWTAGGEAAALNVLKKDLESKGVSWTDMPVAGGAGDGAMTVLRARITAGNPPTAVQLLGFDITDWAEQGVLSNLNDVAKKGKWGEVIPKALQKFAKYEGKWIAAPVNVHSTNWVWANKKVLDELGIKQPKTWDEFISALKKVKKSGKIAFAHGGQAWQDATVLEGVILSTGGPSFYKKAMIDLDPKALNSSTMAQAFDRMKELVGYFDSNFSGRDWNVASAMVIDGKAAFQIMGDWAKGEFLRAKMKPGKDFLCFRVPGTKGSVTFNSDQFAMFQVGKNKANAQKLMAAAVMDPKFQIAFNVVKGSVPARTDVSDAKFDACGKEAMKDLKTANQKGTLMGSMAHGYGAPASVRQAFNDVATDFVNNPTSGKKAAQKLASAFEEAK